MDNRTNSISCGRNRIGDNFPENKRGEIETYTDEKGVLRSYGITEERLQNNKYQEILRDFFKTQKENNVKYIYELEEML